MYYAFYPSGSCPYCLRHIETRSEQCVHCGRTFSAEDRANIALHAEAKRRKGLRLGFIVFGVFLLGVMFLHDMFLS